ncbi:MAG: hypothetical protein AAFR72_12505, partial [Pseudomonadota bacterium]
MRFVVLFLLLIMLGFIAWKAVERFHLLDLPKNEQETIDGDTGPDSDPAPAPGALGPTPPSFDIVRVDAGGNIAAR